MNYQSIFRGIALAGLLVIPALGASAQGTTTAAAPPTKVGVISIGVAVSGTAEGKQALAELQSKYAGRQNELENLNKQIEDLRNRLRNGERTLSDEEKARLQRQGDLLTRQLERKNTELQEDANADKADMFDRIGRKLVDVIDRFARENGYIIVFDTSSQAQVVIYASSQNDITKDVVRLYDQAYPVKPGTSTTTTPPTQRPPAQKPPVQKPPKP